METLRGFARRDVPLAPLLRMDPCEKTEGGERQSKGGFGVTELRGEPPGVRTGSAAGPTQDARDVMRRRSRTCDAERQFVLTSAATDREWRATPAEPQGTRPMKVSSWVPETNTLPEVFRVGTQSSCGPRRTSRPGRA
jgi:hypothetical protein